MRIHLNGEERQVAEGVTLTELLAELELRPDLVAVERNRELVPRAQYGETVLAEGDRIEVVTLVGGG